MDQFFNLPTIWYILVGFLFMVFAILDGFDLGVGMIYLFAKKDHDRRVLLNTIGPVWDGNEVWLVVGGGALFAAFPDVYATVLSGFYLPFFFLLFGIIFRAVAIEFRSKEPWNWWRKFWDISFSVASFLIALIAGIALGNILYGVPIGVDQEFSGNLVQLLNPYALLVGMTTVAVFAMHGSIYAYLKTKGELYKKIKKWVYKSIIFFCLCYMLLTMATLLFVPHLAEKFKQIPWLFLLPVFNLLIIANIPRFIYLEKNQLAFLMSALNIAFLMLIFGIGLYPSMVVATDPSHSLTAFNSSASTESLKIMLIIAMLGMPFVIAYTIAIQWIFRGKVNEEHLHY